MALLAFSILRTHVDVIYVFLTSDMRASQYFVREEAASLGGIIDEATQEIDVVRSDITAHGTWSERL